MEWRGYVKDRLNLTDKPKAYLMALNCDIKQDLITSATSSFSFREVPLNVSNGDILLIYDEKGQKKYQGIIKAINETNIETYQIVHLLSGNWYYDIENSEVLENSFKTSLENYCKGIIKNSSYIDPIVEETLGSLEISISTQTSGNFETQDDNYVVDMEQFIYDLYSNYQIMVDIDIKYEGTPTITIGKSTITELKLGDNTQSIVDINPTLSVEETNRLIIYSKENEYRTTYVVNSDGTRVEQPNDATNRFGIVNTKFVFSDDEIEDLLNANLPSELYNHKLTFVYRMTSKLFKFDDFKLGMPLKIWKSSEYFNTILTGIEFSKTQNVDITEVTYTCGMVRTSLTKKLLMQLGVRR